MTKIMIKNTFGEAYDTRSSIKKTLKLFPVLLEYIIVEVAKNNSEYLLDIFLAGLLPQIAQVPSKVLVVDDEDFELAWIVEFPFFISNSQF
jgi:aspartyl-tRNA synthetase